MKSIDIISLRNHNRNGWYEATNTDKLHWFINQKPLCGKGFPFYNRQGRKIKANEPQENYCAKCSSKLKQIKDENSSKEIPKQDNISLGSKEPQTAQLLWVHKGIVPV